MVRLHFVTAPSANGWLDYLAGSLMATGAETKRASRSLQRRDVWQHAQLQAIAGGIEEVCHIGKTEVSFA